jgi:Fe-Mn family superoxide dismutase
MKFVLPPLPYPLSALEPVIGREALHLHHDVHHRGYVDKLNAALERVAWSGDETIEQLLRSVDSLPDSIRSEVRNFGGGHANHSLMWETLAPGAGKPSPSMLEHIERDFGDLDGLRARFVDEAAQLFGSGWVFLAWDEHRQCLAICSLQNQDSPYSRRMVPLLPCDLWEHAHYLDYRNRRDDWVRDWWYLVDWRQVEKNLERVRVFPPV